MVFTVPRNRAPTQVDSKDPNSSVNYAFDWADELKGIGGDTIDSQTCTPTGVTLVASSIEGSGTRVRVRLSGGTVGQIAKVHCRITTTNSGETMEQTMLIPIVEH